MKTKIKKVINRHTVRILAFIGLMIGSYNLAWSDTLTVERARVWVMIYGFLAGYFFLDGSKANDNFLTVITRETELNLENYMLKRELEAEKKRCEGWRKSFFTVTNKLKELKSYKVQGPSSK